jgi:CheY-like chemotaxis protein
VVVDLTEARVGRIEADPSLVEQILVNLFVNARDAMPDGGRIELSTAVVEGAELARRGVERAEHARYVRLSIRDTGHGIDASTMARIFEPFFSTRERGKGSGLGLSTVYGQGTVFLVYFPQSEAAPPRRPSGETRLSSVASAPPRRDLVLLVDDEELIRNLSEQILADRGYQVVSAASATEALEVAGRLEREIDLLLTDIVMPGLSGLDLAQRLQKRVPRLRVLFMSGYADSPLLRAGLAREGAAFLQKPFTADALERRVRELLEA